MSTIYSIVDLLSAFAAYALEKQVVAGVFIQELSRGAGDVLARTGVPI
jgi:hypothetical protein